MAQNYSAKEHDGLRKDGQPDQRLSSEHGFGGSEWGVAPSVEHRGCNTLTLVYYYPPTASHLSTSLVDREFASEM